MLEGVTTSTVPTLFVTADGGATWTSRSPGSAFPGGPLFSAGWCASLTGCTFEAFYVRGTMGAYQYPLQRSTTTDGGLTWATTVTYDPSRTEVLVTCATPAYCLGTSDFTTTPGLFVSTDGGQAFSTLPNDEPPTALWSVTPQGIACPSATTCVALVACTAVSGPDAFVTSDAGGTWQALPAAPVTSLDTVSCPTAAGCLAAGTGTNGGGVTVGDATPTPVVGLPAAGASLHGSVWLDASTAGAGASATLVVYELSGNGVTDEVVSDGTPTIVGELGAWDTTDVPNGTYTVTCVATGPFGLTRKSAPVTVHVGNLPLAAAVLVPAAGSVLEAGGIVDASAAGRSDVTSVAFALTGGTLARHPVATGTPTVDGWIGRADLASVPAGTYQLTATATDAAGHRATSPPVTVTVTS